MVDKEVEIITKMKFVRKQYNPIYVVSPIQSPMTPNYLKIKIAKLKFCKKSTNIEISFFLNEDITFITSTNELNESFIKDTKDPEIMDKLDISYIADEGTDSESETEMESEVKEMDESSDSTISSNCSFGKESKFIVF